jgi:site-specific recombinase XerD
VTKLKDYTEALEALKELDLVQAVRLGLADRALMAALSPETLSLAEGRRLYPQHVNRPRVVGGARPASTKRYRPVFDKFEAFAQAEGLTSWNQVTRRTLEAYAAHLDDQGYAYATEYLELTTLKQVVKWLVLEGHLPASCLIQLPLTKPQGTTTYCWRAEEVQAMILICQERQELRWLAGVLTALACTGLRISELAALRCASPSYPAGRSRCTRTCGGCCKGWRARATGCSSTAPRAGGSSRTQSGRF